MAPDRSTSRSPRDPAAPPRTRVPALAWGALLIFGGAAVWASVPGPAEGRGVPDVWRGTGEPAAAARELQADVREGATHARGDLLKLWWPAHPRAESYRITFDGAGMEAPVSVKVRSNLFLYALDSNALHLPPEFTWEVAAVLPDGSEVMTPPRRYPGR